MSEIWKDVVGYEGLYQVSGLGNVRSLNYNKTGEARNLKQFTNNKDYLLVTLSKNNRAIQCLVHRLVAEAFIPNPDGLEQINHKDRNRQNNTADNLEWCDCRYNLLYEKGFAVRCVELDRVFDCASAAEKEIGVCARCILKCCAGTRKTAGGYHWQKAT